MQSFQLNPPTVIQPSDPAQIPQSQMLAQVLQQMKASPPQTGAALGADLGAQGINAFSRNAQGQGGAMQWRNAQGAPSGNWMDSPLAHRLGGLFNMGQAAQGAGDAAAAMPGVGGPGFMALPGMIP